jgi:hypothetical protein
LAGNNLHLKELEGTKKQDCHRQPCFFVFELSIMHFQESALSGVKNPDFSPSFQQFMLTCENSLNLRKV